MPVWMMAAGGLCLLIVARTAARRKRGFLGLLASSLCGVAGLAGVIQFAPLTSVELALNSVTLFISVVLGLPGVILMVALSMLL